MLKVFEGSWYFFSYDKQEITSTDYCLNKIRWYCQKASHAHAVSYWIEFKTLFLRYCLFDSINFFKPFLLKVTCLVIYSGLRSEEEDPMEEGLIERDPKFWHGKFHSVGIGSYGIKGTDYLKNYLKHSWEWKPKLIIQTKTLVFSFPLPCLIWRKSI